jgi:hypothetical protein
MTSGPVMVTVWASSHPFRANVEKVRVALAQLAELALQLALPDNRNERGHGGDLLLLHLLPRPLVFLP